MNRHHNSGPSLVPRQSFISPKKANDPFTNGLLAIHGKGQAEITRGVGTAGGDLV